MPLEQDILQIGFDVPKAEADKNKIIAIIDEVIAKGEEFGKTKLAFGDPTSGLISFTKANEAYAKALADTDNATKKHIKTLQDHAKATEANQKAQQATLKTEQQVIKVIQEEEKAEQQSLKTKIENAKYQKLVNAEKAKGLSTAQAEVKIANQAANEYYQLGQALKDAELRYKNLALTQGFSNEATKGALKEALAIRGVLNQVDQSLGNHQRNVGNYASAYNGLNSSFQQILREAPSAAVSLNTFFLAISNNLPMFFDEVQKIKQAQKEAVVVAKEAAIVAKKAAIDQAINAGSTRKAAEALGVLAEKQSLANAQQGKAPSLLKQLGSSLFSINSLLTVSVLVLTLFGGKIVDWVSSLFKGKETINDLAKNLENLNEVMATANKEAASQKSTLDALYKSATNANIPLEDRLKYVNKLQEEFPAYFKNIKDEVILNGGAEDSYNKLSLAILESARARAAKGKIDAIEAQRLDIQFQKQKIENATAQEKALAKDRQLGTSSGGGGFSAGTTGAQVTITRDAQIKLIEVRRKGAIEEQDARDKQLAVQSEFLVKFAGGEQKIADVIVGGVEFKEKAEKAKKAVASIGDAVSDLNKELAAIDKKEAIGELTPSDADIDRVKAFSKAFDEIFDRGGDANTPVVRDLLIRLSPINERVLRKQMKDLGDKFVRENDALPIPVELKLKESSGRTFLDDQVKLYREIGERQQILLSTQQANEETLLQEKYNKGEISEEKYRKTKLEIIARYGRLMAEEAIKWAEFELESTDVGTEEREKAELKLARLKMALAKAVSDVNQTSTDNALTSLEKFIAKVQIIVSELQKIIGGIIDASAVKQKNALKELEDLQQDRYAKEVDNVRNSTLREEEKASRILILEKTRQIQKEQNERKSKEIDERKARFNKASTIAEIVIATALAVTKSLPNIPLAILNGVLGAAQLAIAIATPIPKYAKGAGVNGQPEHPGGKFIAGEEYKPELVNEPGKKPFVVNTPTLLDGARGTKVIPLTTNEINSMMYKGMALQMAHAIAKDSHNNDASLHILKEIAHELKRGKGKHDRLYIANNKRWDKWNASINKDVRGL